MSEDPKRLAQRFWRDTLWSRLAQARSRVVFVRTVRRDEFVVNEGVQGTVVPPFLDEEGNLVLAVRLDVAPPGAAAYEDEVHWREGVNIEDVEHDIRVL